MQGVRSAAAEAMADRASRGHAVVIPFGGARVGRSPRRGAHRAMAGGRNPTVRRGRRPQRGLRTRTSPRTGPAINDSVDSIDSITVFREGRTGVRRLTQIGADNRSHKRTQRRQNGRCVAAAVKVGTTNPAAAGRMNGNRPAVVRAGRREAEEPHTKTRSHEAECRSRSEHRYVWGGVFGDRGPEIS
jgi:hypothetical protein